ncbi:DUF2290 domain-containing protein [Caballeronia sordidicola]|uniref:DUF2290 domain-containing protein n=1 Tax=Caballeronia sordidicola TaxID=196367 RepID=UPI00094DE923|nr:DUF2290 domain-containing protein [Caballeronia sordidicola]
MVNKTRRILDDFAGFLDEATEKGLLRDSNQLVSFSTRKGMRYSWDAGANLSYLFTDHASIEQYVEVLLRRDYSFCLFDGGIIQIDYTIKDNEIMGHRLCYTPCPFHYEPGDWIGIALSEIPSMMSASELIKDARLGSPIRFDFDSEFNDEKHAHSHLTLNKQTCRIPTYGPLSLGHFFRFILRYFYESNFDNGPWLADVRPKLFTRTLTHPSPHEMHIESAVGY